MHVAELVDHGDHEWYALDQLPSGEIDLVVCDGPPGSTKGGRYGALPLLHDRLAPGAVLLLDDADRDGERTVLRRWEAEFGVVAEIRGTGRDAYAVVRRSDPT